MSSGSIRSKSWPEPVTTPVNPFSTPFGTCHRGMVVADIVGETGYGLSGDGIVSVLTRSSSFGLAPWPGVVSNVSERGLLWL